MKITTKEAAFLGELFKEKTPISLLSNIQVNKDGSEKETLTEKGILVDGALSEDAKELLEIMAKADKSARLVLQDNFAFLEKYVYRLGDKYVLAENDGGYISIYPLLSFENITFEVAEFTGMSLLKTVDIELELPPGEMFTLLSLIDHYRINTLLYHGNKEEIKQAFTLKDILKGLESPERNGLVKLLANNYGYTVPKKEEIENILETLRKKGLINKDNSLNKDLETFARSLLIPSSLLLIEGISQDSAGEIYLNSGLAVIAGLRDIGYFILGSDIIGLRSLSGRVLLEVLENYLRCPETGE